MYPFLDEECQGLESWRHSSAQQAGMGIKNIQNIPEVWRRDNFAQILRIATDVRMPSPPHLPTYLPFLVIGAAVVVVVVVVVVPVRRCH